MRRRFSVFLQQIGKLFAAFSIAISGLTLVALVPLAATKPAGATQVPG